MDSLTYHHVNVTVGWGRFFSPRLPPTQRRSVSVQASANGAGDVKGAAQERQRPCGGFLRFSRVLQGFLWDSHAFLEFPAFPMDSHGFLKVFLRFSTIVSGFCILIFSSYFPSFIWFCIVSWAFLQFPTLFYSFLWFSEVFWGFLWFSKGFLMISCGFS